MRFTNPGSIAAVLFARRPRDRYAPGIWFVLAAAFVTFALRAGMMPSYTVFLQSANGAGRATSASGAQLLISHLDWRGA